MKTICACGHAKTRHRQQYGEPCTGPCRDCACKKLDVVLRPATDADWRDFVAGRID